MTSSWQKCVGLDVRSLAVYRMGMALVVLRDLYLRAHNLTDHYTDAGAWPRAMSMMIQDDELWSLHMYSGTWTGQAVLFGIHACACICLLIGFHARASAFTVWLLLVSLHTRTEMVNNFGDQLVRCMLFWSVFLPLGRTWSYDAWQRLRHGHVLVTVDDTVVVVSMAGVCFHVQLALVYLLTAMLKSDPEWRGQNGDSSAIYYALHVDYYVTWLGALLRDHISPALMRHMTTAVLYFEYAAPFGLFLPWRHAKTATVIGLWAMHMGLGVCFHLGVFTSVYLAVYTIFMADVHWDALLRHVRPQAHDDIARIEVASVARASWFRAVLMWNGVSLRAVRLIVVAPTADRPTDGVLRVADTRGRTVHGPNAWRYLRQRLPWWPPHEQPLSSSSSSLSPSSSSWLSIYCTQVCLAFAMWYTIASNVYSLSPPGHAPAPVLMPASLHTLGNVIRLRQDWSMFAPAPPRDDGWFVFVGIQHGTGRPPVDPFRGHRPITWAKPADVHTSYRDTRWMAYLINVWTLMSTDPPPPYHQDIMDTLSAYLCKQQQQQQRRRHDGDGGGRGARLYEVRVHYMREHTMPSPRPPKLENWKLWVYTCDQYSDDDDDGGGGGVGDGSGKNHGG